MKYKPYQALKVITLFFVGFWLLIYDLRKKINVKNINDEEEIKVTLNQTIALNVSKYVTGIKHWKYGINYAQWDKNQSLFWNDMSFKSDGFNEHWTALLSSFQLNSNGCNIVDIGANDGKFGEKSLT